MKTLAQEFFDFIEKLLGLRGAINFFLYHLPADNKMLTNNMWWLVPNSDSLSAKMVTNENDNSATFTLNYRCPTASEADRQISMAREIINSLKCVNLPNYTVFRILSTNTYVNQDLDTEHFYRGSTQITVRYYEGNEESL